MAMHFSKEEQEKLENDPSELYKKRTKETVQEEIANLSAKGKLQQFKDYYLKGILAAILIIGIIVYGIRETVVNQGREALYIAIQKDAIPEEYIDSFQDAIGEYLGLDPKKEIVTVNISATDQFLQTYFYAGRADILITDEQYFGQWGQAEYFYSSEDNEEVSFYKDYDEKYRYYTTYVTGEDIRSNDKTMTKETQASDKTKHNCGLYLTDSEKYKQLSGAFQKPVLGIAASTSHLEDAEKFVEFMMDNNVKMTLEESEPS
jgi:hypothetical protein